MPENGSGGFAQAVFGALHYLYRLGTLCITMGVFLVSYAVLKDKSEPLIFGVRLILWGFGIELWRGSLWKELQRYYAVAFLAASLIPTRYYSVVYDYLK